MMSTSFNSCTSHRERRDQTVLSMQECSVYSNRFNAWFVGHPDLALFWSHIIFGVYTFGALWFVVKMRERAHCLQQASKPFILKKYLLNTCAYLFGWSDMKMMWKTTESTDCREFEKRDAMWCCLHKMKRKGKHNLCLWVSLFVDCSSLRERICKMVDLLLLKKEFCD
jgi:hypothetical protein